MASAFSRSKRRITPPYKTGIVKMGYYNPAITNNGVFQSWHPAQLQVQNVNFNAPYSTAQITMDNIHSGPPYTAGGPFRTLKINYCEPYYGIFGKGAYERNDKAFRYVGGFGPPSNLQFGGDLPVSDLNVVLVENSSLFPSMGTLGDQAWQRAKPKLEQADGFVFLAEGKELGPMLKQTSQSLSEAWKTMGGVTAFKRNIITQMRPKKIADDFLNYQFGWKPFLNDLRKFDNLIQNSVKYADKIRRDNGRWVRRKVTLGDNTTFRLLNAGTGVSLSPGLANDYFESTPKWELYESERTHVYAVGRFKYYRPEFDVPEGQLDVWNAVMQAITMSGLRPTPSNVYQAVPWSWAIDWMSNIGQHVDYYSDVWADSLACEYFFVMQHRVVTRKFRQTLPFPTGLKVLEFDRVIDSKQRQSGLGPYGYSLTWDQLTPRQLAIAGALGISRK